MLTYPLTTVLVWVHRQKPRLTASGLTAYHYMAGGTAALHIRRFKRSVPRAVPVVDLFAGPGGLAEGFSECRWKSGDPVFQVALSIEKDRAAHRTLLLRAFLRTFETGFPHQYYDFLNGMISEEPDWQSLYPKQWAAACGHAKRLELGTPEASAFLHNRIAKLRKEHGGRTVLIGGPPCQAYSVIGRSRNAGNDSYDANGDQRLVLYERYVEVVEQLQPAIAVMENVRGLLSARLHGDLVFPKIMDRLRNAGGENQYQLFALATPSSPQLCSEKPRAVDFLVHAERFGIPQKRHRIFVACIRRDFANVIAEQRLPQLTSIEARVSLNDVIGRMPRLRSRLSRRDDPNRWKQSLRDAYARVSANQPEMSNDEKVRFNDALAGALATADGPTLPACSVQGSTTLPPTCPRELQEWLFDERLSRLPNNETKAHMADDLARYLFATVFGQTFGRSPKTSDFPRPLMPQHANWYTGNFQDRYRVQLSDRPSTTVTSHLSKDGHYFIHPDPGQCRSLTVREAARLQTFPDNYFFHGNRTQQYVQVGNAVPPYLAHQIGLALADILDRHHHAKRRRQRPMHRNQSQGSAIRNANSQSRNRI